jgi:hypothetical protein
LRGRVGATYSRKDAPTVQKAHRPTSTTIIGAAMHAVLARLRPTGVLFFPAATDRSRTGSREAPSTWDVALRCGLKHQHTQYPAPQTALPGQLSGHADHLPTRPKVGWIRRSGPAGRVVERRRLSRIALGRAIGCVGDGKRMQSKRSSAKTPHPQTGHRRSS